VKDASALLPQGSSADTPLLPKAYVIAEIEVVDAAAYEGYKSAAALVAAKFGGRYIVRGGEIHFAEGDAPSGRVVVLEFANLPAAQAFLKSDEYRPVAEIRHKAAKSRIMIVEGIIP
jgi:uncharacterized protein (DUF1330 family)